jgi:GTP1/Obg family GTP-binding protein
MQKIKWQNKFRRAKLDAECLRLRLLGRTVAEIAQRQEIKPGVAQKAVARAMKRLLPVANLDQLRREHAARLLDLFADLRSRMGEDTAEAMEIVDKLLLIDVEYRTVTGIDAHREGLPG